MATMTALAASLEAHHFVRAAAVALDDALAETSRRRLPGEHRRRQLAEAIELGQRALAALEQEGGHMRELAQLSASMRATLVRAHAARAQEARHGAGQLSLGSQRAPTRAACDDGWRRVEAIVEVAEAAARAAAHLADELDSHSAVKAVRMAEAAARDARRLVDERNHAYTFHADPAFSFGEGWYLAAAAVLAGVAIQVEPRKPQTPQAERFLRDAGLGAALGPYRSRPRANKHLPEIVARAFHAGPLAAQSRLRAAFVGDAPLSPRVTTWTDRKLTGVSAGRKVLLWVRYGAHHPTRNTTYPELAELAGRALAAGLRPVLVGDALHDGRVPSGAVDLTLFWKDPVFQGIDTRRAQLHLFEHLKATHGLVGQLGVTTAGMDGPALLGLPTMYLTHVPNVRLGTWVGAVPGYEEIVRGEGYLERISDRLRQWSEAGAPPTGLGVKVEPHGKKTNGATGHDRRCRS